MVKKSKKERTAAVPYEVQVYDVIYSTSARYRVLSFIGEGSFGKVAKCVDLKTAATAAIKIHKDCRSYEIQREVAMLERLRAVDPEKYNLVRFLDSFMFKDLSCLAFEMLDKSLYNFMSEREKGLHLNEIRPIAHQLLVAFEALKAMGIVHGDLKPDNVMLVNHKDEPFRVKLIDFGLAIPVAKARIGRVMQAVAYRAPEVTLALPLSEAMDMWGLGCVLALLYFREHLFPGSSNYYLIQAVCHLLGQPDDHLLDYGRKTWKYFNRGRRDPRWILKTPMEYKKATGIAPKTSEWGFKEFVDLREAVVKHGYENGSGRLVDRRAFTHLLRRLLNLDAEKRITPDEALGLHFVTMKHLQKKNINNSADEALKLMKFASEDYFQRCVNSPSDSESVMQSTDIGVVTQSTDPGVSSKGFSGWKDIVPAVTYDNPPPTSALSIENNERSSQIEIIIPISHVSSFLEENIKEPSDDKASAGIHSDGKCNTDSQSEGELVSSRSKEDSATCGDDNTSSKRESPGIIKKDPLPENLSAEHSENSTEELDTDGAVYKAPSTPPTTALSTDILTNASYWANPRDYCNQEISCEIEMVTPISHNSSFLEEDSIEPSNDMASAGLDYGPLDTDSYSEGKLVDTDSYSEGKLVALRSKEDSDTSGDEIPANTSSKRESPRVIECPPLELGYYSDSSDEGLNTDGAGCKAPSTPESTDRLMVISSSQDSAPVQLSSPEHGYHNTPPKTALSTDILINASYWTSPRDHCNKERSREIEIVTPISQNVCILEENDIEPRNDMASAGMDSYETSDTEGDREQELVCFSSKEYSAKSRDEIPANTSSKRESPQVIEWPPLELGYYSDSSDEGLNTDGAGCKAPSTPESTNRLMVISSSQDSAPVQPSSPEHGYHNTPPKTALITDILINASYWKSPRDHCNKERSREIEIVTPISQNVCILEENYIEPRNDMASAGMDSYETSDTECDREQELVCFSSKEYSAKSRDEIPANTSSKRESPQVIEWPPLELGYYSDSSDKGLNTDGAGCKAPSTPESTDRLTVISSSQDSVQVQPSSPEQTETSEERLQAMKTQRQLQAIIKARLEKAFITTANAGGACGAVVRTPTHPIYQIKKINGQNAPANVTHDDSADSTPANNGAAAAITSVDLDNHNNGPGRARQAKPFDRMVKLASRIKSAVVSVFRRRNRVYATKVLCTAS